MDGWVGGEVDGGRFPDRRLKTRLGKLLRDLGRRIGETPAIHGNEFILANGRWLHISPGLDPATLVQLLDLPETRRASC